MTYRATPPASPRVPLGRYGPFLPPWDRGLFIVTALLVTLGGLAAAAVTTRLACTPGAVPGAAACSVVTERPLLFGARSVRSFDAGAVRAVEVSRVRRGKNGHVEQIALIDARGLPVVQLEAGTDAAAAEAEGARLRAYFADPRHSAPLEWVRDERSVAAVVFALAALALAIAGLRFGFQRRGTYALTLDAAARRLHVTHRWFGATRAEFAFDLTDVVRVGVERGPVDGWLNSWRAPPPTGSRVVLLERNGRAVPLLPRFETGAWVHRRVAQRVADALGLPGPAQEPRDARPRVSPATRNIALGLAAVVLLGAVAQFALMQWSGTYQGTLVLRSAQRCQFQGATLLPGAEMQMGLDPGSYPIDVWNPSSPSGWDRVALPVARGRVTEFVCQSGASAPTPR